ncbi:hypothetical protein KC19_2G211800, partial [Ceratodon purpureus]
LSFDFPAIVFKTPTHNTIQHPPRVFNTPTKRVQLDERVELVHIQLATTENGISPPKPHPAAPDSPRKASHKSGNPHDYPAHAACATHRSSPPKPGATVLPYHPIRAGS